MPRSRKVVVVDRAFSVEMVIMDHMRKTSLVEAKAHLSELVDAAEHRGQRVLILRRGKPAAAIVPISVAQQPEAGTDDSQRLSRRAFRALLDRVAATPKSKESIRTALGRDRLDEAI